MNKSRKRLLARIGVMLPFLLGSSFALGQTKSVEISVDNPRPMEAAVRQLEELSGIPINFEGVPFYYSADLKDVTAEAPNTPPAWVRLFAPLGGQLSVSIAVDEATGKLNDLQAVRDALSKLISAYNSSGLPGSFDFEEYKGVFFVKPVSYRDKTGATQPMKPFLSTLITLPEEKRNVYQTIGLILQQVSKASSSHIGDATSFGTPYDVTFGANNEPADHAFARFLAEIACRNSAREGCGPVIAGTSWDIGYHYGMSYAPGYGYGFGISRVKNSRWFVPPAPSKPYSPPPSSGDKPGTRRVP